MTLTGRQKDVLDFIRHRCQIGMSPTYREITAEFGYRSPNAAACIVRALVKKGAVVREGLKARSIRLVVDQERRDAIDYLASLPTERLLSICKAEHEFESVRRTEGEPSQ